MNIKKILLLGIEMAVRGGAWVLVGIVWIVKAIENLFNLDQEK